MHPGLATLLVTLLVFLRHRAACAGCLLTCFKPACHTRAEASALVHSCCSNAKDLLAPVHKLQYSTLGMSYIRKYSYACIVPSRKYAAVLLSFVGACA